jgi:hypothetical protein
MTAKMPRRIERLIDRVCDRDARYFREHPAALNYVRPYVRGEFYLFEPDFQEKYGGPPYAVRVTQIAPGIRQRQPLFIEAVRP